MIRIESNFDSGNIITESIGDDKLISLRIRKDTNSDFLQWFYFRASGIKNKDLKFEISNAGETSYPEGWKNYNVIISYDKENWFRIPSKYENGKLSWALNSDQDVAFFAYFAPYTYEQHLRLIHRAALSPLCTHSSIGHTVEGRSMDLLKITATDTPKYKIWIIARQHPGESMTEWFMEGLINRLLNAADAVSADLLRKSVFYLVPNMNPDGAIAGNLRSNAAGMNLNREWAAPSEEKSPEVFFVLREMEKAGMDLMLDVHGDEELPYNFIAGNEGNPDHTEEMAASEKRFKELWQLTSPDFQTTHGYSVEEKGTANMGICSNQICHKFNVPALTIEMPFKDNDLLPNPHTGWSAERSREFGASVLLPIRLFFEEKAG